jgi:mannose-6-phosphate isomerase-like protein (cupin superfamily)
MDTVTDKNKIASVLREDLRSKGLEIAGEDFVRPWGGFFKIDNSSLPTFLDTYFKGVELPFDINKLNVSPKILVVEPGKKLSWQSHERRSELWRVVKGPVGIYTSPTDEQPEVMDVFANDEIVEMQLGTRHRLVGLDNWGVVAEIWVHQFPDNPSDEDDIRRITDDFGRG